MTFSPRLRLNSCSLPLFSLSVPLFLPSLGGLCSAFEHLSSLSSALALQRSHCASRGLDETGYFTPLLALIRHATEEGFIMEAHARIVMREATPGALLDRFATYQPAVSVNKWVEPPPEP